MPASNLALLALFASAVAASPAVTSAKFCSVVNSVVTKAQAQAAATAFCSSYIHIPQSTKTSTTTPLTTTTITSTSTVTPPVVTTTDTETETVTPVTTTTTTVTRSDTTETHTQFGDTCPTATVKAKRNSKPKPSCLNTYTPGAPLSSACSCLSIPPSTVTTTVAAPTSTVKTTTTTTTSKAAITTGTTTTTTVTADTHTVTETTQVVPTVTTFALNPPPCTTITEAGQQGQYDDGGDLVYHNYFSGCHYQDTPTNSGYTVMENYFPADTTACSAINQCAYLAASIYDELSFAVYKLVADGRWLCEQIQNANDDASQRTVNPAYNEVYFYST